MYLFKSSKLTGGRRFESCHANTEDNNDEKTTISRRRKRHQAEKN